jgi:hypothetical protein
MNTRLQPGMNSYWTKTASQAARGCGMGAAVGFAGGFVYALIIVLRDGPFKSEVVPAFIATPLFFIGLAGMGMIAGAAVGAALGFLFPVRGSSASLADQLPLKLVVLTVGVGFAYFAIIGPRLAKQRQEVDFQRAIVSQNSSEVRRLVESGAKPDTPIGDGTPLMAAAQQGNVDLCRYLLSRGADVNKKNFQGETALIVALKNRHADVAQALVEGGADVNLADAQGQTPLILAAQLDSADIVDALLTKHAEINYVTGHGSYSPLISAVMYRHEQNVELLLRAGADPNLAPQGGASPLLQARRTGNQAIVDLLTAQGAR